MTDQFAHDRPIQRALITTSDKTGLLEFAKKLADQKIEIVATSRTAALLKKNGIPVTEVAEYTGFPEIMDGRVKTLHPKLFAGILRRDGIDDEVMQAHQIHPIDLLVINLYPFQQTVDDPKSTFDITIEQIDVGGPSLLRAGAKNFKTVTVIVDPSDYKKIAHEIETRNGATSLETRQQLAQKVFSHLAQYDSAIADYLRKTTPSNEEGLFPMEFQPHYHKIMELRYGENPHQQAAFYSNKPQQPNTLTDARLLQGKPLSYNNLIDSDTALRCVKSLSSESHACVIVKHATPCGAAQSTTTLNAYEKALATDPTSAFGGIIAFNTPLDKVTTTKILSKQFVEVIIVPRIHKDALELLKSKPNLRVLNYNLSDSKTTPLSLRSISGGLLLQQTDIKPSNLKNSTIVTERQPSQDELNDLLFAWQIAKFTKSNAIVYAKDNATVGIGTGQTSRVFAARIAVLKAQDAELSLAGAVMASDAFFPFADGIEVAANAGITAIIQPGGSKRDNEVISAANKANMAMIFTGVRHFYH